jgi:transposase
MQAYRAARTLLRNRIHAVLADHGHDRPECRWTGPGRQRLASLPLLAVSREVIEDDLALIDALQQPIDRLDWELDQRARSEPEVKILTQLPGVGRSPPWSCSPRSATSGGFGSARKLAAWAGLTPHRPRLRPHLRHDHISKHYRALVDRALAS